jgi:hypothetical protein
MLPSINPSKVGQRRPEQLERVRIPLPISNYWTRQLGIGVEGRLGAIPLSLSQRSRQCFYFRYVVLIQHSAWHVRGRIRLGQPTLEFNKRRGIARLFRGTGEGEEMRRENGRAARRRNTSSAGNVLYVCCTVWTRHTAAYCTVWTVHTVRYHIFVLYIHTVHVLYCTVSPVQEALGRISCSLGDVLYSTSTCLWTHLASVEKNVHTQSRCSSKSRAKGTSQFEYTSITFPDLAEIGTVLPFEV